MQVQPLSPETRTVPFTPTAPRYDLYAGIHKALRLLMTRTLTTLGATDPGDAAEAAASLERLDGLLDLCELHLHDENTYVHPALERAQPGASARIAAEHLHHREAIADLRDLAALAAHSVHAARAAALARLYHALALFVADNLQHMHVEETVHNALLWAAYSDAELAAIEQAIVASIPAPAMAAVLHGFIPALNAPERAGMLAGMRDAMPPEVFAGVLGIAERTLAAADFAKLQRDLGVPMPAAA
ncbi:MAG TPA: hemerythrin domain-containing protein [Rubrivivax sp.]|nr:hemerythrin domain-containing protein [Rubrivivax sp.]